MASKREVLGTVFIVFGIILITLCCVLMLYNAKEDLDAEHAVMKQLPALQKAIEDHVGSLPEIKEPDSVPSDIVHVHNSVMTVADIDGYGYIGYLSFPSLELELPVMDKWDKARMKIAPCLYYGSLYTDDLVVAGHNYQSSFGQLKNLSIGDVVVFVDMDGAAHTYTVADIEILNPTDVTEMVASGWNLSLYTCTYDGSQRLTVRCMENKD